MDLELVRRLGEGGIGDQLGLGAIEAEPGQRHADRRVEIVREAPRHARARCRAENVRLAIESKSMPRAAATSFHIAGDLSWR